MKLFKDGDHIVVCNSIPLEDFSEVPVGTYGVVDSVEDDKVSVTLHVRTRPPGFCGFMKKKLLKELHAGFTIQELTNEKPYLRLTHG